MLMTLEVFIKLLQIAALIIIKANPDNLGSKIRSNRNIEMCRIHPMCCIFANYSTHKQ